MKAIDTYSDILSVLIRPRNTFWSPFGWVNTFYYDTRTWACSPSKAHMEAVSDQEGKLDKNKTEI